MRLAVAGVGAVLVAAVLAGCSDSEQASTTLPSTSSAAASPTSTLAPLGPADMPMPAAARARTPEGATAFVTYYVQLMNRAQLSLATEGLRELSIDCASCATFADGVDDYRQQGYRVTGGGIRLDGASVPAIKNDRAEFSIALTQMSIRVVGPDGVLRDAQSSDSDASYPASGAAAVWSSTQSSWLMADLTIQ